MQQKREKDALEHGVVEEEEKEATRDEMVLIQ